MKGKGVMDALMIFMICNLVVYVAAAEATSCASDYCRAHKAAASGDISTLSSILDRNPILVNTYDPMGCTMLCRAAARGDLEVVIALTEVDVIDIDALCHHKCGEEVYWFDELDMPCDTLHDE
jgi:hypothetical protein